MSAALIYILQSLMTLALFVVLLRLLLQWARADFRNPICQAIVRLTNPLIVPLRRILPPVGKIDTASVVAVVLVAIIDVAAIFALLLQSGVCAQSEFHGTDGTTLALALPGGSASAMVANVTGSSRSMWRYCSA